MMEERAEHVCGIFGLAMHHLLSLSSPSDSGAEIFPIVSKA